MKIDKVKCANFSKLLLETIKMSRDLNDNEFSFIKAKFSIAFGELELQNLENKEKIIQNEKDGGKL